MDQTLRDELLALVRELQGLARDARVIIRAAIVEDITPKEQIETVRAGILQKLEPLS